MHKVFIDGQAGTTGLLIHHYLQDRDDIELLLIDEKQRKSIDVRRELLNSADLVILCLPDDAAIEAVALIDNDKVKILDASTAHRVDERWVYGLPELSAGQRDRLAAATRVSNPGCYPTGFLLLTAPLVEAGLLPADTAVTINAISGYSGGGRALIEKYEARRADAATGRGAVRPYRLDLMHKHLPEMKHYSGLTCEPLFTPAVGDFHQGMLVQVPLFKSQLTGAGTIEAIHACFNDQYREEPCIRVHVANDDTELDGGFLDPEKNNGTNRVDLFTFASDQHILLVARLDNLGKGASGAAIQNLNLMMGCDELLGLQH